MKFSQPHSLGKDEAKRRVERLTSYWHTQYGVNVDWQGDQARFRGKVKGIDFDANVTISESAIEAEGTDPGLLIRAAATAYLKKKLSDYLDPSKNADDIERLA
jgi:hypothetical protein